jgi:hypothetical protein
VLHVDWPTQSSAGREMFVPRLEGVDWGSFLSRLIATGRRARGEFSSRIGRASFWKRPNSRAPGSGGVHTPMPRTGRRALHVLANHLSKLPKIAGSRQHCNASPSPASPPSLRPAMVRLDNRRSLCRGRDRLRRGGLRCGRAAAALQCVSIAPVHRP